LILRIALRLWKGIDGIAQRKQEGLLPEQLNYELASDFKDYLVNNNLSLNRIGMTEVSASDIIKKFRTASCYTTIADDNHSNT
jgi:hypothetical protein